MANTLRHKLKQARREKGYSLDELAKLTETSKSYLWELENREGRSPSGEKLNRIALALDVTPNYLIDDKAKADDVMVQEAFFRKFNKLDDDTQERVRDMIDTWSRKK